MATSKERTIFVFNLEWVEYFEDLDAEARLKFYESIVSYAKTKEMPADLNNYERGIFKAIKNDIDRLDEKYEETKRKRSEAGRKGGLRSGEVRSETKQNEANEANASFVKQNEANEATISKSISISKPISMSPYNGGDIISPAAQEENLSLNHQARDFVRFFNEKVEGTCIPQVKKITEKREIAIGRILHTMGRETMEEVIVKATSPNCILATENRGVGIDWFINEDNAIKVLEGNYDNTRTNQQGTGMGKQEARHLEQLRQLAGGDPERLAYLEATYENR
jgi:hypothetical protein